jgi:type I restriction enzyme M protein
MYNASIMTLPDNKKEQERAKLHSTIWKIANDLRGSVDGWDFKQYVLGMLLYRFISENLTNYINTEERKTGATDFSYATLSDDAAEFGRKDTVNEKGFYVLPSELFENVRKHAKNDDNLNETLSVIFRNIENSAKGAESEDDIKGLFDDIDVNSNKLGSTVERRNKQLVKLMDAVGELQLGSYQDNTIDAFGDAYEFLMGMYASNAGKSGGEYYTPQEVSELLARITVVGKTEVNKVYDPAVGSGSLLLQFAKILGKDNVRIGFYGQEINITTYNLCRINMILHDINYEKFSIAHGDTLVDPSPAHWDEEPFEAIVSNPPYSIHWAGDSDPLLINDPRFSPAGVLAPKSKADLAFTLHMLSWLSTTGTAAIVQFPGVLYRSGAEQKIRKYLIDNNFVDAVIQLPPELFFGTPIATCILVLKKSKKDNATLFIDASAQFVRYGNKSKLSEDNRNKILDGFTERQDIPYFTKLVQNSELSKNDYNLSVSSYVDQEDIREVINIAEVNSEIANIVNRQGELRKSIDTVVMDFERHP